MILTRKIVKENNLIDENGHCTIPEGYTVIEECVFHRCKKLKSIELPVSLKRIDRFVFYECINLESIVLPDNLKYIGENAFWNCTKLNSIVLPDSIEEIKFNAFKGCESIKSIKLPNNLRTISLGLFERCASLESIELPNDVKLIQRYAFFNCTNLKSITLPNSLEEIESRVFLGCTNLGRFKLPDSLKKIGNQDVFYSCTSLPKIGVGKEILEVALKDNYFKKFNGLHNCFHDIISRLMLKYKKPICLEVELPMFTFKNALKLGVEGCYWVRHDKDKENFIKHMLSEIEENSTNDEILILRR